MMKFCMVLYPLLFVAAVSFSQPEEYHVLVKEGLQLYQQKQFRESAAKYSEAFKIFSNRGFTQHRYEAASSFALSNQADSAFFQLFRIATRVKYSDINSLTQNPDFTGLHSDPRWTELVTLVTTNKRTEEAEDALRDRPLMAKLDSIHTEDQKYRQDFEAVQQKYGWNAPETQNLLRQMQKADSINVLKIIEIIEKYGWPGVDLVGVKGSTTVWLVIQHADIEVQEKYLPMMREAVKNGKARASELAYLEDRILLRRGKKQLYGSQVFFDNVTKQYDVAPLEDPLNVDKRRASVGLGPLSDYTEAYNFKWDPAEYRKRLPAVEKKYRSLNKGVDQRKKKRR
jgi:hypothetical protein